MHWCAKLNQCNYNCVVTCFTFFLKDICVMVATKKINNDSFFFLFTCNNQLI